MAGFLLVVTVKVFGRGVCIGRRHVDIAVGSVVLRQAAI